MHLGNGFTLAIIKFSLQKVLTWEVRLGPGAVRQLLVKNESRAQWNCTAVIWCFNMSKL